MTLETASKDGGEGHLARRAAKSTVRQNEGFITPVLLIVAGLLVLGFYGLDLKGYIDSPVVSEKLAHIQEIGMNIWNIFFVTPALWLWEKVQTLLPGGN